MLALIAAAALSQALYTWTDSAGVVHYTDDASQVPRKARRTQGGDLSVLPAAPRIVLPPRPVERPVPAPAPPQVVVTREVEVQPATMWAPVAYGHFRTRADHPAAAAQPPQNIVAPHCPPPPPPPPPPKHNRMRALP